MSDADVALALEVVAGPDRGARLVLDGEVRTVGRARDADLRLRDPAVSRRHLQVTAARGGAQIAVCGDAEAFVVDGAPARARRAKDGERIAIGGTVIAIVAVAAPDGAGARDEATTQVAALLGGDAADVRAMAAVHELVGALDRAVDRAALDAALAAWAAAHAGARAVEVVREPPAGRDPLGAIVERGDEGGGARVVVPARTDEPTWVALRGVRTPSEPLRRMLAVAGRVYGSALVRVEREEVAREDAAAMRARSFGSAPAFLGASPRAKQVAAIVQRLAASDVPVLLEGETGVGKTFIARLLHEASRRAREPFRVINCAALPEGLVESELFGHERGAFTGAVAARAGALEAAGRGTLLLDEIGELSLTSQAKLLRVLEDRSFERVGSTRSIELRARVVFATNRDLEAMVAAKAFRSDLFFRVSVTRVAVPPLRERGDDLVLLAKQLLADAARGAGRRVTGFTAAALEALARYAWPGNVRELRNAIEHAVALGEGTLVDVGDLPPWIGARPEQPADPDLVRLPLDLATLERRAVEAALRDTGGNRARAAALLGINRSTLYDKLKEYGS